MTIAITGAHRPAWAALPLPPCKSRAPEAAEVIALARNQRGPIWAFRVRAFDYTKPETLAPALWPVSKPWF